MQVADDPSTWTVTRLADGLAATGHRPLKELGPRAAAYVRRIRDVHGAQHPELEETEALCDTLASVLETHLRDEEDVVFPALRRTEQAERLGAPAAPDDVETIARSLAALRADHERFLTTLDALRGLTMDYALPFDACATYGLAFRTVRELDAALRRHLAQEDDVLLPKAADLLSRARGDTQAP